MSKTPEEIAAEAKTAAEAAAQAEQKKLADEAAALKAKLEETEKELGQAQHTIVTLKKEKKSAKDDGGSADDGGDGTPVAKENIAEIVTDAINKNKEIEAQEFIDEQINALQPTEDGRKLLKLIYDKKIVKSGFTKAQIQKDLAAALAIVNAPKLEATVKEVAEAAKAKNNSTANGTGGGQFGSDADTPGNTWNAADQALLKRYGVELNKK